MERGRELNKERRGQLNLLLVRQAHLTKKVQADVFGKLLELKEVSMIMGKWYIEESNKIAIQANIKDLEQSENVRIYHHALHQKSIKNSSILRLQTDAGLLEGYRACAEYLEQSVASHLLQPAALDPMAQQVLLADVKVVFTEQDNKMLCTLPTKEEVWKVLMSCESHSAPGNDGISAYVYKQH